jgi:hypothetical protein
MRLLITTIVSGPSEHHFRSTQCSSQFCIKDNDQNMARWAYHQRRPGRGPHRAEITVLPNGAQSPDLGEDDRWRLPADVAWRCAEKPLSVL